MNSYAGSTALVTGASKGLGEQLARELAGRGAHLVLVARSEGALENLASQLRMEHGVRVEVIATDLSERSSALAILRQVEELGIEIDLLVNNAGLGTVGPFLSRPLEPSTHSVDVNVVALMELMHHFGSRMLDRGRGGIINVASVAAFQPMPFQASYGAAKAFVLSLTEALAEEVRGTGLRVMAAHPGATATSFFDHTTSALDPNAVSANKVAKKTLDDFADGRSISFPGRSSDRLLASASRILTRRRAAIVSGDFNRRAGHDQADEQSRILSSRD